MRVKLSQKIYSIIIVSVLLFTAVIAVLLMQFKESLIQAKAEKTKNLVEVALSATSLLHKKASAGEMSQEEAKKQSLAVIRSLRYDDGNYLFVNDFNYTILAHPEKPELEGQSVKELQDAKGKYIFQEFVAVCEESGEGLVDYQWAKAGFNEAVPKISYVKSFKDWGWVIGTGVYLDDIESEVAGLIKKFVTIILAIVFVVLLASVIVVRSILKPLKISSEIIDELVLEISSGKGDLNREIPVTSSDEVGELTQSFNAFLKKFREVISDVKNTVVQVNGLAQNLASASSQMNGEAEKMTAEASSVAGATEEVSMNINMMASATEEMSVNINSVSAASEQMSSNMTVVSDSMGGIQQAISEIEQIARESEEITCSGKEKAELANSSMKRLSSSTTEIGKVTEMIKKIAEQTNLLALNATIEAASAGDAGKGFAVVASEIKELASQSALAAESIANKITSVQENCGEAVGVINEVSDLIQTMNKSAENISVSVEEQVQMATAITENMTEASKGVSNVSQTISELAQGAVEVSNNTSEAATGSNDVAQSISSVNKSVTSSQEATILVKDSAEEMRGLSGALHSSVAGFNT